MTDYPCMLRNAARRPVEIHRGAEVVVLAAGESILLDTADPALDRLERAGVLTRHAPPPQPAGEDAVEAPPGPGGGDRPARKPGRGSTTKRPRPVTAESSNGL